MVVKSGQVSGQSIRIHFVRGSTKNLGCSSKTCNEADWLGNFKK